MEISLGSCITSSSALHTVRSAQVAGHLGRTRIELGGAGGEIISIDEDPIH
jgi:hypothetical protein